MNIKEVAARHEAFVIQKRREFHQIPEASLKEYKTSQKIQHELREMGLEPQPAAGTGVVAGITGGKPGKTVALRADIDALSVQEHTGAEYASTHEGFMHACGHDAHTAMLLGAARILSDCRSQLQGNVRLVFEPGEEVAKGAKAMIAAGAMDGVDSVFGLHVWSDIPAGKISVEAGPRMASADFIFIDIHGKSCHGAMPHQGIDAVVAGAAVVQNLQSIVSRELPPLEPVVITIGEFKAGSRFNIVAGDAFLSGTTRTFNNDIRNNQLPGIIKRVLDNTAAVFRAEADFRYEFGSSSVFNDPYCSGIAEDAVRKILGQDGLTLMEKTPVGENFSEYQMIVPGVFGFVGVRNPDIGAVYPQHSDKYVIDESALIGGAAVAAQYAMDYLEKQA